MSSGVVYITGMGIISAIGNGVAETLDSLLCEKSGVEAIRYLETSHSEFPVGEVKYDERQLRSMLGIPKDELSTRTALIGRVALGEALKSASLSPKEQPTAFISGTTVGGMDKSEKYYLDFLENDSKNRYISSHDCGACSEMIAALTGGFSTITSISTACSSAANAIIMGANMIRAGIIDVVVAGGSECITKFHLNGFRTLMILDNGLCRPFDNSRKGLNLGEGAAYVVLESAESVGRRGVKPLCRLSGYGNSCDAFHQTASSPDGEGAFLAMQSALKDASMNAAQISYINVHGTGTQNNDLSEGTAMKRLFGEAIPPFSSTKQFTGHTTSAAGAVEAVISILALTEGFIPTNLHFESPIEELKLTPVTSTTRRCLENVLSNSFGFGGNDSSLIFSKI